MLSLASDVFATQQNLFNVTRNFAFVAIIAIGMTAVIITGGIDLSVGAVLVLSGMVIGMTMNEGMSIWLAVPLALGASLLVGAINGVLIAYVGVPPFVVTLGMLSIARSLAMVLSDNRMVYQFGPDQPKLLALGGGFVDLPLPLRRCDPGAEPGDLAAGAAVRAGLRVPLDALGPVPVRDRRQRARRDADRRAGEARSRSASTCSAACAAGIAGILEVGWLGTITTGLGQGMELTVIAAAVIGGANLMGGVGTAFGAVVGAALIEVIRNSLIAARHQHVLAGHVRRQLHHRRGAVRSAALRQRKRLTRHMILNRGPSFQRHVSYEVFPLLYPLCGAEMRFIAFIPALPRAATDVSSIQASFRNVIDIAAVPPTCSGFGVTINFETGSIRVRPTNSQSAHSQFSGSRHCRRLHRWQRVPRQHPRPSAQPGRFCMADATDFDGASQTRFISGRRGFDTLEKRPPPLLQVATDLLREVISPLEHTVARILPTADKSFDAVATALRGERATIENGDPRPPVRAGHPA